MCRGEEVQRDVGRENFLRERRLEEGWEAFLEDPQGWKEEEMKWLATVSTRTNKGVLANVRLTFA